MLLRRLAPRAVSSSLVVWSASLGPQAAAAARRVDHSNSSRLPTYLALGRRRLQLGGVCSGSQWTGFIASTTSCYSEILHCHMSPAGKRRNAAAPTDGVAAAAAVVAPDAEADVVALREGGDPAPAAKSGRKKAAASPAKKQKASRKPQEAAAAEDPVEAPGSPVAAAADVAQTAPHTAKRGGKGRGKAKAAVPAEGATQEAGEEAEDEQAQPKPKRARKASTKAPAGPVYTEAMRPPPPDAPVIKLMSWNVAGLRALLKKDADAIKSLIEREAPDVLCLQEIKISDKHVPELLPALQLPPGWHAAWSCSTDKAGYSGVATLSRAAPLSTRVGLGVAEHDGEGRVIVSEYPDFYLVNVYTPNSGEGLRRLTYRVGDGGWDEHLAAAIDKLQATKPVIVCGDLNCAHQEIDIHNPKGNLRSAGFTQEERDSFGARFLAPREASAGCGLVDSYRHQFPDVIGYSYYSYRFNCRAKGLGWRLDYFLLHPSLLPRLHDAFLLPSVGGSDHVPVGVTLLTGASKGDQEQEQQQAP